MTTATEATAEPVAAGPRVLSTESIPLRLLRPHPENPRPPKGDDVAALAANIAAVGMLTPLIVRRLSNVTRDETHYEVLAGHRRVEALKSLKRDEALCQVVEADDGMALRIVLAENADRKDPDLLLEAETVRALLARDGYDRRRVSDELGKPLRWVAQREALATLHPAVVKAIRNGVLKAWGPEALTLLASEVKGEAQAEFVKRHAENISDVDQLKRVLVSMTRRLSQAPWLLDDETLLPKAGTCLACQRTTASQRDLFGVDPDVVLKPADARCLDAPCWRAKMAATMRRELAKATRDGKPLLLVAGEQTSEDWTMYGADTLSLCGLKPDSEGKNVARVLGTNAWAPAKGNEKDAERALVVRGKGMGTLVWVRVIDGKPKKAEKSAGAAKSEADRKPPTLREREEKYDRQVKAHALAALIERLVEPDGDKMPTPQRDVVLALLGVYGSRVVGAAGYTRKERTDALADVINHPVANADVGAGEAWRALTETVSRMLEPIQASDVLAAWDEACFVAKVVGIDPGPFHKAALETVPVPKALAAARDHAKATAKPEPAKPAKAKKSKKS